MRNNLVIAIIVSLLSIQSVSAADKPRTYEPINPVNIKIHPHEKPGSIGGDYKRAVRSKTLPEAVKKWEEFLRNHDAEDFEDGFHANHVRLAKYELMRIYYIVGEVKKADAIIKKLAQP